MGKFRMALSGPFVSKLLSLRLAEMWQGVG